MKKIVRLTENDLARIVKRVIRESDNDVFEETKLCIKKAQKSGEVGNCMESVSEDWGMKNRKQFDELMELAMAKSLRLLNAEEGGDYYDGEFYMQHGSGERDWYGPPTGNKPPRYRNTFDSDEFEDEEYGTDQWDDVVDKYGYRNIGMSYGSGQNPKDAFAKYVDRFGPLRIKRKK